MVYLSLLYFTAVIAAKIANIAETIPSIIIIARYPNTTPPVSITNTTIETSNNAQKPIICVPAFSIIPGIFAIQYRTEATTGNSV